MFTLQDKIFGYFGAYAKVVDPLKDGSGFGLWERYNQTAGQAYDDELQALIDDLLDNIFVPADMLSKMIPVMEYNLGIDLVIEDVEATRRKLIKYFNPIGYIKGTAASYNVLFNILGVTVSSLTEINNPSTFDQGIGFDAPNRTFDSASNCCGLYSLELSGTLPLDSSLILAIRRIITYLQPIDVTLLEITYNGETISVSNLVFEDVPDSMTVNPQTVTVL